MNKKLTKKDAVAAFITDIYPALIELERISPAGFPDWPRRREAWHLYVDSLHRNGNISDYQVQNWCQPAFIRGPRSKHS